MHVQIRGRSSIPYYIFQKNVDRGREYLIYCCKSTTRYARKVYPEELYATASYYDQLQLSQPSEKSCRIIHGIPISIVSQVNAD